MYVTVTGTICSFVLILRAFPSYQFIMSQRHSGASYIASPTSGWEFLKISGAELRKVGLGERNELSKIIMPSKTAISPRGSYLCQREASCSSWRSPGPTWRMATLAAQDTNFFRYHVAHSPQVAIVTWLLQNKQLFIKMAISLQVKHPPPVLHFLFQRQTIVQTLIFSLWSLSSKRGVLAEGNKGWIWSADCFLLSKTGFRISI